MIPKKRLSTVASLVILVALISQTVSCGTILYPERRQPFNKLEPDGRQIDPAVAVLDGVCLFFFIVPGVIAFAVDFSTGCIYFPRKGKKRAQLDESDSDKIAAIRRLSPEKMNGAEIEKLIRNETGVAFHFDDPKVRVFKGNTAQDPSEQLARLDQLN